MKEERGFFYRGTDPIPDFCETMEQYHTRVRRVRKELEDSALKAKKAKPV